MNVKKIICPRCPDVYSMSEITAYENEQPVGTLAELTAPVVNGDSGRRRTKRLARAALGIRDQVTREPNYAAVKRLRARSFRCPRGHEVDGNPGDQLPIAVIGSSGASKSHVLAGIVRELDDQRSLAAHAVKLTPAIHSDPKIKADVNLVYGQGGTLEPTARGELQGPFSHRLTVGDKQRYSLMLFDIAGEDLQTVVTIAERAQFVVVSRGILVLIDPDGFLSSQFDAGRAARTETMRIDAARDVRDGIRAVADALIEVWGVDNSTELEIPVCFAVSKADAVDWPDWYDWTGQTRTVAERTQAGASLQQALVDSSTDTREAILELGGGLVVEEIEDLFDSRQVRYASLSATSTMPATIPAQGQIAWESLPKPEGVGIAMLQLLELAGIVTDTHQPAGV